MAEGQISQQSISNITRIGIDPGYSPNSYPMTDGIKHSSIVTITLNDQNTQNVLLEDDPADHRGLLSWINQKSSEYSWTLDEAGSYGYLVNIKFNSEAVKRAVEEGVFRVKLAVNDSSEDTGGLAVYGEYFGRYPLDPTIIMRMK